MSPTLAALAAARAALQRGDLQACFQAAESILRTQPRHAEAAALAGLALLRAGRAGEAEGLLTLAAGAGFADPRLLPALGECALHRGDPRQAHEWFKKAAAAHPGHKQGWLGLAVTHRVLAQLEESVEAAQRVLALDPVNRDALEIVCSSLVETGRAAEALQSVRAALAKQPDDPHLLQLAVFPLLYTDPDPAPVAAVLRSLGQWLESGSAPARAPHANPRDPDRKLRVGYVSREFHNRWAPRFIGPLIEFADPHRFEVFCYYQTVMASEREAPRSPKATWHDTTTLDDAAVARLVRQDAIDILVDLGGWTRGTRLPAFALAPAPVQMTYLGFPGTTGLPTIGYRIVDGITDPASSEAFATEELIRMPACFLCPAPNLALPVAAPPCTSRGNVTFGSFNTMAKVGEPVLTLWAQVLKAVPGSRLLLKNRALEREPTRSRVRTLLQGLGIAPDRLDLRGETASESEHLEAYANVDIALDPFPYNGATTTFDALWMGVPVVTLLGRSHVSRVSASMLTAAACSDFIATTPDNFVAKCVALAADPAALAAKRAAQRQQVAASPLCDGRAFVRALESRYREAWARWCSAER
jgi:predicted O-linked N-acetylglucosamine transferase (SPINDLY family)